VSGLHAVRVAAKLKRELQIIVELTKAHYGEFQILVDGEVLVDGGAKAILGIPPSGKKVVDAVRLRLSGLPGNAE
jgi:hypothetical protein